jgi:S-ribosylhomocysteine lyase LuxS involved in autoinducer biosynthesis
MPAKRIMAPGLTMADKFAIFVSNKTKLMKKIFALSLFVCGFAIAASAQTESAKSDAVATPASSVQAADQSTPAIAAPAAEKSNCGTAAKKSCCSKKEAAACADKNKAQAKQEETPSGTHPEKE